MTPEELARAPVPIVEIIRALEREAGNTDTDPRWRAATELRRITGYERRTLICRIENAPDEANVRAINGEGER